MKINVTLADICRPEDWLVSNFPYVVVRNSQEITEAEIHGKDLLALAAHQQEMPEVITIQEAEYLGIPYTKFQGFALMKDSAKEVWLGLAEKIHEAMKEVEFEPCVIPDGMNAYYLLEFDICES